MANITPYDRKTNSIWNDFDKFEKMFFDGFGTQNNSFRTDIVDKGDYYELTAELPGFDKKDISVEIDGDMMTISAKSDTETKEEEDNYVRRERRFGAYGRSFDISNIQAEDIKASYDKGVLEIQLPKAKGNKDKSRKISLD